MRRRRPLPSAWPCAAARSPGGAGWRCAPISRRPTSACASRAPRSAGRRCSRGQRPWKARRWPSPAGPFVFPTFEPAGLTVGDGEHWTASRDSPALAVLALDARGAALFVPREQVVPYEPWMREVVSGVEVLRDGAPRACEEDGCEPAPRAGLGLSSDGRTLVMIAAEGWSAEHAGVTDAELGALLSAAGAHHGIRTADGASSLLWLRDEGAVTAPSDGAPREAAVLPRARGSQPRRDRPARRRRRARERHGAADRRARPRGDHRRSARRRGRDADEQRVLRLHAAGPRLRRARLALGLPHELPGVPRGGGGETWCSQFLASGEGAERCEAPPRGIDAGPWPLGDAGTDAGDPAPPPAASGCAAAPSRSGPAGGLLLGALLCAAALRRRG
ncbi:MAG: phosphodiester glycosidase family protein [Sandaracinaceae bacterium]|nr:phosphodiester glycosidase family protein [Sandaracinaceae bacterium]